MIHGEAYERLRQALVSKLAPNNAGQAMPARDAFSQHQVAKSAVFRRLDR